MTGSSYNTSDKGDNLYLLSSKYNYLNMENNGVESLCREAVLSLLNGSPHMVIDYSLLSLMLKVYLNIKYKHSELLCSGRKENVGFILDILKHFDECKEFSSLHDGIIGELMYGGIEINGVPLHDSFSIFRKCIREIEDDKITLGNIVFISYFSAIREGNKFDKLFVSLDTRAYHRFVYDLKDCLFSVSNTIKFYEGDSGINVNKVISSIADTVHKYEEDVMSLGYMVW